VSGSISNAQVVSPRLVKASVASTARRSAARPARRTDSPGTRGGSGRPPGRRPGAASRAETFQGEHLETHLKGQPNGRFPSGVPAPPSGTEPLNWSTSGYPDPSRGPDRSTTGQVSRKGNGSGRRLWNCLLDRHHGDWRVRPLLHEYLAVALIKANRFNHLPSEWSFGEGSVPGDQRSRVSCSRIWRNSLKVTIRTP
jgi:hypothetical protein